MEPQEQPQPNVMQAVPFFGVRSMETSLRFYVNGLGFCMTKHWIHEGKLRWCWLEHGQAALMLQEFWTEGHHAGAPQGPLGQGVTVCFICRDAISIYREAQARGLAPSRPMVGNGMWVTSLTDPDGYRVDFESETDVPEDAELADDDGQEPGPLS
jgi:catechol 2,3-dioxygenase-like lactoylglutathione lyase family enzyme